MQIFYSSSIIGFNCRCAGMDVDSKHVIKESEVRLLITDNIVLTDKLEGYSDAKISYVVLPSNQYASVKDNTLVINRPYAGYVYVCFTCEYLNKGKDERDIFYEFQKLEAIICLYMKVVTR